MKISAEDFVEYTDRLKDLAEQIFGIDPTSFSNVHFSKSSNKKIIPRNVGEYIEFEEIKN